MATFSSLQASSILCTVACARESPQIEASPTASISKQCPLMDSSLPLTSQAFSQTPPLIFLQPSHGRIRITTQSSSPSSRLMFNMAITHDDLSRRKFQNTNISNRLALFLVIFSVLCGLTAFILCLTAEGSRSEVTWLLLTTPGSQDFKCYYSGSGRAPLAYAVAAFLILAVAMFIEHAYMLIAVTSPEQPALAAWTAPQDPRGTATATATSRDLTWQACCLFLTSWVCFALAELLLMIGIGVESGHLSNWRSPKANCHAVRPGVFAVAGVFGLITVILGVGLYLTALRTQRLLLEGENVRRGRIPNAPSSYPHIPPSAPGVPQATNAAHQSQQQPPLQLEKTSTSA